MRWRCQPLKWLWGLIPLAFIAALVIVGEKPRIEADLEKRASQRLAAEGLSWAKPQFDGRDAILTGSALDERLRARAAQTVRETWGVRKLDDRAELMAAVTPYIWSATRRNNQIKLEGYAPAKEDRQTIIGMVKAAFPDHGIDDRMKLAPGAPEREIFLGGVSFAIKLLGHMKVGIAVFEDTSFSLSGEAASSEDYRIVKTALATGLPKGIVLKVDAVTPPHVSPYSFAISYKAGEKVTLTGHVPSAAARRQLHEQLAGAFSGVALVDETAFGSGAPEGWLEAVQLGLSQLARLNHGVFTLADRQLGLSGEAATQGLADSIKQAFQNNLPRGFVAKTKLTWVKRPPPVAIVYPYTWTAQLTEGRLAVSGYVPDKAFQDKVTAQLKTQFPRHDITARWDMAKGRPTAAFWQEAMQFALAQLAHLDRGRVSLSENTLELTGQAKSFADYDAVMAALSALPAGLHLIKAEIAPPSVSPFVWTVKREGNRWALAGYVPDDAARQALLDELKSLAPGAAIADHMRLAQGAPDRTAWLAATRFALAQLANLRSGEAKLSDLSLTLSGVAGDVAAYDSVTAALEKLPGTVRLAKADIAPPQISPYVWWAEWDGTRWTLGGYVPSEAARQSILTALRAVASGATVVDRMRLARGVPEQDAWQRAIRFALTQLAALASGRAELTDLRFTLTGKAREPKTYETVLTALASPPKGVQLAKTQIAPPKVSPYRWAVTHKGEKVTASGYVPSLALKRWLGKALADLFPGVTVDNTLALAAGAPYPAERAKTILTFALQQLARLRMGEVRLEGKTLTISGEAKDMASYDAIMAAPAPPPLGLHRRDVRPPRVSPFTWRAEYRAGRVVLSGFVPDAATRKALLAKLRARMPGVRIEDRMTLASGAPEGWKAAAMAALSQLSRLTSGKAELTDRRLVVTGLAPDDQVKGTVLATLGAELPTGFAVTENLRVPPKPEPAPAKIAKKLDRETLDLKRPVRKDICQTVFNKTLTSSSITFDYASARLRPEAYPVLDRLAKIAAQCPKIRIEIAGHTDSDGSPRANRYLSLRRARTVAQYLVDKGIDRARLDAVGYGATRPLVPNTTKANKQKNRRIEFTVSQFE